MNNQVADGSAIAPFENLTETALSNIRHIYESVPATRDTLAALFAVDAAQSQPTEAWTGFFVETACSQLLWDHRPTGTLTKEDADWVLARFDAAPTLAGLGLLVRLIEEAHRQPPTFSADVRRRAAVFDASRGGPRKRDRSRPVPYLRLVA